MIPPVANRFVAGETPAEALAHVHEINERGVGAICNLLGEHYDERSAVAADVAAYRTLATDIGRSDLRARLSVKPTQLGLDLGEDVFRRELGAVVETAARHGVFVWIDMEDRATTDATLDAYVDLAREHDGGVGVCLQANLKRTREDVERLAPVPGTVRFVKGAYDEPAEIAYRERPRVNRELEVLLEYAFEHFEGGIALGSHDPAMIERTIALGEEYDRDVELQLLMGVREDLQFDLAAEYDVWQYAPYGDRWASYFYRRLRERTENVRFAARAILGR